jgi:hypothetical protein
MEGLNEGLSEFDALGDPFGTFTAGAEDAAAAIAEVPDNVIDFNRALETAEGKQAGFRQSVDDGTASLDDYSLELYRLGESLKDLPDEQIVNLSVNTDDDGFKETMNFIEYVKDGVTIREYFELDKDSLKTATEEIDEKLPSEKSIELQAKMDMEKLKTVSDLIQTEIEWEAKLEIAEVEANAQKVEAIMTSLAATMESSGNVLTGIFSNMESLLDAGFWKYDIEKWINQELALRREALGIQKEVAEAELKLMAARAKRIESGDAMITIAGEGLQPQLEAFMWEILKGVQIKVNEEGLSMLTGT